MLAQYICRTGGNAAAKLLKLLQQSQKIPAQYICEIGAISAAQQSLFLQWSQTMPAYYTCRTGLTTAGDHVPVVCLTTD
jgi:hypothetical protein